jgi:uncharacterized protein with GYD domain
MALFMIQAAYTPEAWANMATHLQERRKAIRPAAANRAGQLIDVYFCHGEYDVVLVVEAPDATSAALSIGAVTTGQMKLVQTTPLFPADLRMADVRWAGADGLGKLIHRDHLRVPPA